MSHPIRNEPINVWCAPEGQASPKWIAKFGTGRVFPIFFEGASEGVVRLRAETFRDEVIAKYEAAYEARMAKVKKGRKGDTRIN
jgi:hypothetical protein